MTTPAVAATPTILYLARHGESEWNHGARVTGQADVALSAVGREQARVLAAVLADEPLAAIYTSALQRTRQMAAPTAAAVGLAMRPTPALNEIHLGVLQGRYRDERDLDAQALWQRWQADPWNFCVPDGERFEAFTTRVGEAFREILQRHRGQHVLVVGHRATNRVVLGTLLGWPRARWIELKLRNKFCYRLTIGSHAAPQIATIALGGRRAGRLTEGFEM